MVSQKDLFFSLKFPVEWAKIGLESRGDDRMSICPSRHAERHQKPKKSYSMNRIAPRLISGSDKKKEEYKQMTSLLIPIMYDLQLSQKLVASRNQRHSTLSRINRPVDLSIILVTLRPSRISTLVSMFDDIGSVFGSSSHAGRPIGA